MGMSSTAGTRYSLEVETLIVAGAGTVWSLLTDPGRTGELFWGCAVESDFTVGSPITWKGTWDGTPFEDRGTIKRVQPNSLLQYTHWSTATGTADDESAHNLLTFQLTEEKGGVRVVLRHENIASMEMKEHSEPMWNHLLATLKEMAEKVS
jgi:uncharacterized protein YndB with AHSA1/START domain